MPTIITYQSQHSMNHKLESSSHTTTSRDTDAGWSIKPRLPVEILLEMFCHTADDQERGSEICVYLGQVCRRWRQTALNHKSLWCHVVANGNSNMELLCLLLRRSGSLPLYVNLCDGFARSYSAEKKRGKILAVFSLVFAELPRIRSLRMKLQDHYFSSHEVLNNKRLLAAPQLRIIDADLGMEASEQTLATLPRCLQCLHRVNTSCYSLAHVFPLLQPSVTHLRIEVKSRVSSPGEDEINTFPLALFLSTTLPSMKQLVELDLAYVFWDSSLSDLAAVLTRSKSLPIKLPRSL